MTSDEALSGVRGPLREPGRVVLTKPGAAQEDPKVLESMIHEIEEAHHDGHSPAKPPPEAKVGGTTSKGDGQVR